MKTQSGRKIDEALRWKSRTFWIKCLRLSSEILRIFNETLGNRHWSLNLRLLLHSKLRIILRIAKCLLWNLWHELLRTSLRVRLLIGHLRTELRVVLIHLFTLKWKTVLWIQILLSSHSVHPVIMLIMWWYKLAGICLWENRGLSERWEIKRLRVLFRIRRERVAHYDDVLCIN